MAVPAGAGSFLRALGFTDMCLANNHILDCGPEAIEVTRDRLTSLGIRTFGAGCNIEEAERVAFANFGGRTVAFLGACDSIEYYAGKNGRAGIAPMDHSRLGRRVRAAAANADLVVVMLHADLEFSDVPGRCRQRLSRWLVDQGAQMVVQHHPHVLQGIGTYRGGLIAYSLGNFIFRVRGNRYLQDRAGVFDSVVLVLDADMREPIPKLAWRVVPVRIRDDHFPTCSSGLEYDGALQLTGTLSSLVGDPSAHRQAWHRRCRLEAANRIAALHYALRRGHFRRAAREFWRIPSYPEDRRWIRGLFSLGHL